MSNRVADDMESYEEILHSAYYVDAKTQTDSNLFQLKETPIKSVSPYLAALGRQHPQERT